MKHLWIVAVVLFAGCATAPSYTDKALKLEMGMSKSEVIDLFGQPKKTSARTQDGDLIERYSWWAPERIGFTAIDNEMVSTDRIAVKFVNGEVTEWGDSYDPGAMTDRALEMQKIMLENMQNAQQPEE